jgi:hypothetical protein
MTYQTDRHQRPTNFPRIAGVSRIKRSHGVAHQTKPDSLLILGLTLLLLSTLYGDSLLPAAPVPAVSPQGCDFGVCGVQEFAAV